MEDDEAIELPDEYEIPEPEGFKNLTKEQKENVVKYKRLMDKELARAARENQGEEKVPRNPMLSRTEKKDKASEKQEAQIMGKYLLRDMPLFKYEIMIYAIMGFVAFFAYILERTEILPGLLDRVIIPIILVPIAIWFIKWMFYMPTKKKVPSMRIYKSGVVELGVDNISKGYITYGHGESAQKKFITKLNKHTEASTGKPFLVTSETQGENLSLIEGDKPDMRSEEFNAILENLRAVVTKSVMNKMLNTVKPSLSNPLFMVIAVNIALTAVLIAKEFGLLDMIG